MLTGLEAVFRSLKSNYHLAPEDCTIFLYFNKLN